MGEAFILKRGAAAAGGLSTVSGSALLCVKYPAGSSCRCENGAESHSAEAATGLTAFALDGGSWTVTVSDGARAVSDSVSLTGGEVRVLTLAYPGEGSAGGSQILTSEGLAAGYSLNGNAVLDGGAIQERGSGGFWLSPAIDLTPYDSVTVRGTLPTMVYGPSRICAGSTSLKTVSVSETPEASAQWTTAFQPCSVTLDVSALSGEYYLGSTTVGNTLRLTEIILT